MIGRYRGVYRYVRERLWEFTAWYVSITNDILLMHTVV